MEVSCTSATGEDCDFVATGDSAEHLAEEIMQHTAVAHSHLGAAATAHEHRVRLLQRIEDMLAGGAGTPV